jgi:hypothetical protein
MDRLQWLKANLRLFGRHLLCWRWTTLREKVGQLVDIQQVLIKESAASWEET